MPPMPSQWILRLTEWLIRSDLYGVLSKRYFGRVPVVVPDFRDWQCCFNASTMSMILNLAIGLVFVLGVGIPNFFGALELDPFGARS